MVLTVKPTVETLLCNHSMMYKVALTFKPFCVTIQMKAKRQHIRMVLLKNCESDPNCLKSVDETLSVGTQQ